MTFNVNDPLDLVALRDEEVLDPIGMGYADVNGITHKTLDLFNNAVKNVGGETTDETLTPELLLDAMVPDDLTVDNKFPDGARTWLQLLFEGASTLQDDLTSHRDKILELFNESPQTETYIAIAALSRAISRAEALFGIDTVISKDDWITARDYTGDQ